MQTYSIKIGDTLSQIALHYGISLHELLEVNPQIENPNLVFAGQIINIPTPGISTPTSKFARVDVHDDEGLNVRTQGNVTKYTLITTTKSGTIFEVVKRNPTWWQIVLFKSDNFEGGQVLGYVHKAYVVPHASEPPPPPLPPTNPSVVDFLELSASNQNDEALNLRTRPVIRKSTFIAKVKDGTTLEVVKRHGNWVQVVVHNNDACLGGRILAWVHSMVPTDPSQYQVFDIVDELAHHQSYRYSTRSLQGLEYHVVHHSATRSTITPYDIANYHVNTLEWPGIGYSFFISADGTVYQTNYLETMSYGVFNQNRRSISTCLGGYFTEGRQPTNAQLKSFNWLHNTWLPSQLGRSLPLHGHKEMPGQSTMCPGNSWDWHAAVS